jgi:hypothetical protein
LYSALAEIGYVKELEKEKERILTRGNDLKKGTYELGSR